MFELRKQLYSAVSVYTISKNDVISSIRKRYCVLGLGLGWG